MGHAPRVCASGQGKTSSRTRLIILFFGKLGHLRKDFSALLHFLWELYNYEGKSIKSLAKRSRNPKSEASNTRPHRFQAFAFCRYLIYIYISTAFIYFDEKKMWRLAGFGQMLVSPAKRHQNEMGGLQKRDRF